jgi:hypothetical protein
MEQDINHSKENRSAGRYPTFCTVELDSGTGVTRNLSTMGVCFITDNAIEPDSMLRCFILMQKMGKKVTRLRCEGRVVRINKFADGWEVAINLTTLEW